MDTKFGSRITRRGLLQGGSALALGAWGVGAAAPARAAVDLKGQTVVFASWGGAYQDAEKVSYCEPFAAATGAKVLQDGPMNVAKFRSMIEGGAPDWDVADITIDFLYAGTGDNLFEKIDTKLVDLSRVSPQFVHEYGVGCIVWSYNLGYSTKVFPAGKEPKTWADLFDLKRFPGKRTMNDNVVSSLEVALLADGVHARQALSARCRSGIEEARHHQVRDDLLERPIPSRSSSSSTARSGSASSSTAGPTTPPTRARRSRLSWEQNIQSVDYLVVPRGSRNRAAAMALIDTMTQPENQAKLANLIAYAPTNPAAFKSVDPKIEPWLSTAPENVQKGFVINAAYLARQSEAADGALEHLEARLTRALHSDPGS